MAYDYDKVLARHMADGMTEDEAVEFFEFNQIGAWVGGLTPCFVQTFNQEESPKSRTDKEITREEARSILEDVLDTLIEVGNGTTDEMLHEAADKLFRFRDKWFKKGSDE